MYRCRQDAVASLTLGVRRVRTPNAAAPSIAVPLAGLAVRLNSCLAILLNRNNLVCCRPHYVNDEITTSRPQERSELSNCGDGQANRAKEQQACGYFGFIQPKNEPHSA